MVKMNWAAMAPVCRLPWRGRGPTLGVAMPDEPQPPELFGPNAWLVDEMYEQYRADPSSVSESWRDFFEDYRPGGANLARPTRLPAEAAVRPEASAPPAPSPTPPSPAGDRKPSGSVPAGEPATALRGAAARVVANMEASLEVPTATSFRVVPARLLEVNRRLLNDELRRTGTGGKVSFTHLIGFAVVEALRDVPALNSSFVAPDRSDAKVPPSVIRHEHVGLGIAVDLEKSDGSRTLLVPAIRRADTLDFRGFWLAYEELIRKVRTNKIGADDFAGATVSLTNPGTIGTVQSVPRLMPGQGAIIGVGTIDYPAEWQAADRRVLAELGVSKVVTVTSTYDHRIIQGAESGLFLQKVHRLLIGEDSFYQNVFKAMGVPYEPVPFHRDVNDLAESDDLRLQKQTEVDKLINLYRVRGHLIAHLDPLDWK